MPVTHYLLEKHRNNGVIVDTNLMVLVVVGLADLRQVGSHKRTAAYTLEDFQLLTAILGEFSRRIVTPNIVTEVDNLSRQCSEDRHTGIARVMHGLLRQTFEVATESVVLTSSQIYPKIGVTDVGILSLAKEYLVLTDDYKLSNRISSAGLDAINFNHLRDFDLE